MPTTIYDSSLITQRRKNKTISGSFNNRIQNLLPGSAPLLGITEQSLINTVYVGQMKEYRKNDGGCIVVSNGCPCAPKDTIQVPTNDIIGQFPGQVSNIQVNYGSVIVTWTAPIIGVEAQPFTYELTTTPSTATIAILGGITTYTYIDPLTPLTPGTNYIFNVKAINSAGVGPTNSSIGNFYAPYPAPTGITIVSQNIVFNGIDIGFNNYTANFTPIPTSSILYTNQGNFQGIIFNDAPGGDSLTVVGLSPSTIYSDCYLVLINGNKQSNKSSTFNFTTRESPPPPLNVVQGPSTSALINMSYYSYTEPTIVTLNIPTLGTYNNPTIYTNSDPTASVIFSGIPSGSYTDCTLTLGWANIDNSIVTTPVSNTFTLNII
jgi:hypothetical protein